MIGITAWRAALTGAAALLITLNAAQAATSENAKGDKRFATEYAQTLPPVGFVQYCLASPEACNGRSLVTQRISLSGDRWQLLFRTNSGINAQITAVSDQLNHGVPENWSMPANNRGDCEDYVLLKKAKLATLGFATNAMKITVVLDEEGNGHAVLTLVTEEGDYVLDNRRDDIRRWTETGYTFLKRQSDNDPKRWMALVENKTTTMGALSASNK